MTIRLVEDTTEALIQLLHEADLVAKEALERKNELQEQLVARLRAEQHKSKTMTDPFDPNKRLRAVMVANRRTKVDEAGLKKALGTKAFRKVTIEKVDMGLLEEAVSSGELDAVVVKQYLSQTEHPTVRLYVLAKDTDDEPDE